MLGADGAERKDRRAPLSRGRATFVIMEVSHDGLGKQGERFLSPQIIMTMQSSSNMGSLVPGPSTPPRPAFPPPGGYQKSKDALDLCIEWHSICI